MLEDSMLEALVYWGIRFEVGFEAPTTTTTTRPKNLARPDVSTPFDRDNTVFIML
jgi:hypothetical protein